MSGVGYVYRIDIGPKYYFGQTIDFARRSRDHRRHLESGVHKNRYMQRAYDKYREIHFTVLYIVNNRDSMDFFEQRCIDRHFQDRNCLNLEKTVCVMPRTKQLHPVWMATINGLEYFTNAHDCSKDCGVSVSNICRWMNREVKPSEQFAGLGFGKTPGEAIQMLYFNRKRVKPKIRCFPPNGDAFVAKTSYSAGKRIESDYGMRGCGMDVERYLKNGKPTKRMIGWRFEYV